MYVCTGCNYNNKPTMSTMRLNRRKEEKNKLLPKTNNNNMNSNDNASVEAEINDLSIFSIIIEFICILRVRVFRSI